MHKNNDLLTITVLSKETFTLYKSKDGEKLEVFPFKETLEPIFIFHNSSVEAIVSPMLKKRNLEEENIYATKKLCEEFDKTKTKEFVHKTDSLFIEYLIKKMREKVALGFPLDQSVSDLVNSIISDYEFRNRSKRKLCEEGLCKDI